MLSRVADSLFWMSRYLERAEHTARVMNVQLNLMLERVAGTDDRHWARVLRSLGVETDEDLTALAFAQSLLHSTDSPSSIISCIIAARENARQVREQISTEMWEQLNRLFHEVKRADDTGDARDFMHAIKEGAHLFQGITDSTMTHAEGWQFIQAGRHLERAVAVAMLVGVHFEEFRSAPADDAWRHEPAPRPHPALRPDVEPLEWIGLLQSCTAFEAYCKAYTAELHPDRVAEFLVLNPVFPHSIRFSADALAAALKQIGGEVSSRRSARVERIVGRMQATLAFGQIDEIMSSGLRSYLDTVRRQCAQVHSALYQTHIAYAVEAALGA